MKKLFILLLAAASSSVAAETAAPKEETTLPPAKIDVSKLPRQADMIGEVVVPKPDEIFGVLDQLGKPRWEDVLRKSKGTAKPMGAQPQNALLLGIVIAEGFIAVEAEDTEEVKNIGNSVLNLANAIGVRKAVMERSNAIKEGAQKKNWAQVRRELAKAQGDVRKAMDDLRSAELAELVSLGGWLRGTEALTQVVKAGFTKEGAELLHQPVLIDYFDQRIGRMEPKFKKDPLVVSMHEGLVEIRPLMGVDGSVEISEKTVKEINAITERLIKAIQTKAK